MDCLNILDQIRKERKNDVCVTFAREGSTPLADREHTLDAVVRRELASVATTRRDLQDAVA